MAPFYEELCRDLGWPVDTALLATMKEANAKTLASFEESIKDAEENLGETEVRDLLIKKAEHYSRIGDKVSLLCIVAASLSCNVLPYVSRFMLSFHNSMECAFVGSMLECISKS